MKGQSGGRKITCSNSGSGDNDDDGSSGGSECNFDRKMNWRSPNQEACEKPDSKKWTSLRGGAQKVRT